MEPVRLHQNLLHKKVTRMSNHKDSARTPRGAAQVADSIARLMDGGRNYKNPLQMAEIIAGLVLANPGMSRSEVIDKLQHTVSHLDSSDNTVYRWITKACEEGWLERQGTTSAARYFATPRMRMKWLREQLSRPPSHRPKCTYNEDFLDSYVPNETFYLSAEQRARLAARCPIGSAPISALPDRDISLFLTDVSYSSSHLEGNEYNLLDTVQLLTQRVMKDGGSMTDRTMIENHYDAVKHMIRYVPQAGPDGVIPPESMALGLGLRVNDLLTLHALLTQHLMKDPNHCGRLRRSHVEVKFSSYIPMDFPARIEEQFAKAMEKANAIRNPWEQAFFLNVHIPYLQPTEDGNKRLARVACNIPLIMAGVTPMSWLDVPTSEYRTAMLAIYEHNDPVLLAEVFTEGYMRSCERLQIMQKHAEPDAIAVEFRTELKQTVRAMILRDEEFYPPNVSDDALPRYVEYAQEQIDALCENPLCAAQYMLEPRDVVAYNQRQQERERAAAAAETAADMRSVSSRPQPARTVERVAAASRNSAARARSRAMTG